eukprot:6178688-Pleurochrysis_carterae.AAC.1
MLVVSSEATKPRLNQRQQCKAVFLGSSAEFLDLIVLLSHSESLSLSCPIRYFGAACTTLDLTSAAAAGVSAAVAVAAAAVAATTRAINGATVAAAAATAAAAAAAAV